MIQAGQCGYNMAAEPHPLQSQTHDECSTQAHSDRRSRIVEAYRAIDGTLEAVTNTPDREHGSDDADRARGRVRLALKATRTRIGLNQTDFAIKVLGNDSRFVVNRLEHGTTELSLEQAKRIDEFTENDVLVPLVEHRDRLARAATGRDELLRRMLRLPQIEHVRVVLVDDLPLADLIRQAESVPRLEVVLPTRERSGQISMSSDEPSRGRPLDGFFAQQITALLDLAAKDSQSIQLQIVESDDVGYSIVHCMFDGGAEVAWWPRVCISGPVPGVLPVANSGSPGVCAAFESEIQRLVTTGKRLQPNDLVVTARGGPHGTDALLTRLAPRGDPPAFEVGESYAVALVLPYSYTSSSHGIAPRLILHTRKGASQPDKLSLVSARLEESDLHADLTQDEESFEFDRVHRDPNAGAVALGRLLSERDGSNVVPINVFRRAAARDFLTYWGIPILDLGRFHAVDLPPELRFIEKEDDPFVARLFSFELSATTPPGGGDSELTRFLQSTSKHDQFVIAARPLLRSEPDQLNSFLDQAIQSGFMANVLADLNIVDE